MKKLMIAALALIGFTTAGFAQTPAVKKTEPAKLTTAKKEADKSTTAKVVPMNKPAAAATKAPATKKDGTADMRFKANKDAAKTAAPAAGPLKKDGTKDMRYKENKKHS